MKYEVKVVFETEANSKVEAIDNVAGDLSILGVPQFKCWDAVEKEKEQVNEIRTIQS